MLTVKKLERIQAPDRKGITSWRMPRCQKVIRSTSTGNWGYDRSRCCRYAIYIVNGVKLCKQHAGDMCLAIALGID